MMHSWMKRAKGGRGGREAEVVIEIMRLAVITQGWEGREGIDMRISKMIDPAEGEGPRIKIKKRSRRLGGGIPGGRGGEGGEGGGGGGRG